MKKFYKMAAIMILAGLMATPQIDARGRNNGNSGSSASSAPARPSGSHGGSAQPGRPGGGPSMGGGQPGRPGGSGPSMGGGQPGRPGGGPAMGGGQPGRPGGGPAMGHNPGPGYGPGHGPGVPGRPMHPGAVPGRPPYRPYMPPPRPWTRPVPPPHFRPMGGYPVVSSILGLAIGTAVNMSLNALINNGYYVTGYTPDAIYLNDVLQLNMLWPSATLYYGPRGLMGSEFVYSTAFYDLSRYNAAYGYLVRSYGPPISATPLAGGGSQVTWFGNGGQFVQLQFTPASAINGDFRYYTTLSYGN